MSRQNELKDPITISIIVDRQSLFYCKQQNLNISELCRKRIWEAANEKIPLEEYKKYAKKDKYQVADEILKTAIPIAKYTEIKTEIIKQCHFTMKKAAEYLTMQQGIGIIDIKEGNIIYKGTEKTIC